MFDVHFSAGDKMRLCPHQNIVQTKRYRTETTVADGQYIYSPPLYQCLDCGIVGDRGEPLHKVNHGVQ